MSLQTRYHHRSGEFCQHHKHLGLRQELKKSLCVSVCPAKSAFKVSLPKVSSLSLVCLQSFSVLSHITLGSFLHS